jgi:methyl-accepting chemotaxis protein
MMWLRRMVLHNIKRCVDVFEAMGTGDLSVRLQWTGRDLLGRLGQSIDEFANRISTMIVQIQRASLTVQSASQHNNEIAAQVEARVSEELSALSQALAYSAELANSAGSVSENADAVARRVSDISSAVAQMTASIQEMDRNLLNLASVVEQAVANTQEMSASIVQVAGNADRVRSESSVTDQQVREGRNEVLALQRHGFDQRHRRRRRQRDAVARQRVTPNRRNPRPHRRDRRSNESACAEVRKLAENSASSTKQIGQLVADIQRRTSAVLERTALANALVQNNAESAHNVTQMIETISTRVTEVAQLMSEISMATTEQARASEKLAKASEQMGAMTHEAAATMREQAVTSNQILESVSEIESRTAQVASSSTEQRTAIEALGQRIHHSSSLGQKNSEAIGGMAQSADEVLSQASSLRELMDQFQTGHLPLENGSASGRQALEDSGALALLS